MLRKIKGGILIIGLLSLKVVSGQNYVNSPYTRYLIGDVINTGFAYNKALGGSSIALRPHNQVNYLNPASYTAQDTNSFLFQVGFTARYAEIQTGVDSDVSTNSNIDYLAIGFPLTKWWNISLGTTPFSRAQYFFRQEDTVSYGEKITFDYSGFGGFNEFYIGNSFAVHDFISVGFNMSYLFGSLERKQESYLTDLRYYSAKIENKTDYIASDFYFKAGLQAYPTIKEKHKITVGITYDFESNIDVRLKGRTLRYNTAESSRTLDSLYFNDDTLSPLKLPGKLGLGLAYTYDNKLTVNAEYITQDWTGTDIVTSGFKAGKYESFRFGVEYNPVSLATRTRVNYFKRIHYRAGGFYTKSYLYNSSGKNITSYGMTAGLGFPLKNARKLFTGTSLNIGYQYGVRGTTEDGLIKENHHTITIGLILHDFWFLKPKYD